MANFTLKVGDNFLEGVKIDTFEQMVITSVEPSAVFLNDQMPVNMVIQGRNLQTAKYVQVFEEDGTLLVQQEVSLVEEDGLSVTLPIDMFRPGDYSYIRVAGEAELAQSNDA